jgi:hypothetical protein
MLASTGVAARPKQIDKAVERMVAAGELMVIEPAVTYWRNRTWNTKPATLAVPQIEEDDPGPPSSQTAETVAWVRRQGHESSRAERKKHGKAKRGKGRAPQEEAGKEESGPDRVQPAHPEDAGRQDVTEVTEAAEKAGNRCPACGNDLRDGRHYRKVHRWVCPAA